MELSAATKMNLPLLSPMEPKFVNPTFRGAEPSWANACVGENGQPDAIDYARGFSAAANLLIERVIEDEGIHNYVDEFIYPICFNMRHSVELRLKNSIETLAEVAEHLGQSFTFNHAGSHDIGSIWSFFKLKSESLDKRYLQINNKINPTITDIAEIDATGQVFRYPTSNENSKHLVEVSIINVIILRDAFQELELNLNLLHRLSKWLSREYSLGTYTEKLSRPMLYEVAKMLPPKSTWASPEFDIAKDRIKNELDLSGRDFSKAINKIKEQHQLASIIESPIPLYGLSELDLHEFCELWFKTNKSLISSNYNDARIEIFNLASPTLMDEMINDLKNDLEAWKLAQGNLTTEKLAGLKALFYFARERDFVEYYQTIYNGYLAEFQNLDTSKLKEPFLHLYRKSNAIENILQSLYVLGYTSTAEAVVETYKLERAFSWLPRARTRQLYKYPDFAGYSAL